MLVVAESVLVLFLLMVVGFVVGKRKIFDPHMTGQLSAFLIRITLPAMLLSAFFNSIEKDLLRHGIMIFVGMLLMYGFFGVVSYFLVSKSKIPYKKQGSWMFSLTFTNNGYIGIPFMKSLHGNAGMFLMSMGNVAQNILIFSVGTAMVKRGFGPKEKLKPREIIYNNVNIAIALGFLLNALHIELPEALKVVVNYVGSITVPLSLIITGISLSKFPLKDMVKSWEPLAIAFLRLILIPLLGIGFFKWTGLGAGTLIPTTLCYALAMPSPAMLSILAERYGTDTEFASQCVFVTTLLSMVTIPLISLLM